MHTILQMVKNDNPVHFSYLRQGTAYFKVAIYEQHHSTIYTFPVPLDDIGQATLLRQDKAILFMRWIRKAIEENTIITETYNYADTETYM